MRAAAIDLPAPSSKISAFYKNIDIPFFRIMWLVPVVPPRLQRGVWPIVTKRGARDAMDAACPQTMDGCCGRQRRVVLAPLGWC